jgi:hypothetical protein
VALAVVGVLAGGAVAVSGLFGRPDGTQRYAALADLQAAMNEHGAHCEDLVEDENPTFAAAQGRCSYGESELVLQLWIDGEHRNYGTDQVIAPLIGSDFGYCWVLGRGDDGAWSINAGVDRLLCRTLAEELGGELREQAPA